jgi:hypothetical protein
MNAPKKSKEDALEIVQVLADGFSKQSKYSNQLWLASIAAAAVLLFPNVSSSTVNLPFSLGVIPKSIFAPVGFGILFILVMAFCQAYAHTHNAATFGQRTLDEFEKSVPEANARDFYDILVTASFARVWPLVDLLKDLHGAAKWIAVPYYVVLKCLTHTFMLGIPGFALVIAYVNIFEDSLAWIHVPALIALSIVIIAIMQIAVAEIRYGRHVVKKLRR